MSLIWVTRGRTWGFRFLLDDGSPDPLPDYERVFSGIGDDPAVCRRVGDKVALRFADPLGRKDASGRIIPHDFVVSGPLADDITTVEDGLRLIWDKPEVSGKFARVWDAPGPPAANG